MSAEKTYTIVIDTYSGRYWLADDVRLLEATELEMWKFDANKNHAIEAAANRGRRIVSTASNPEPVDWNLL